MMKGYCTNCNKHDESRRIFDVNSDTKFCHCPHCGKKYRPKVVISIYERVISGYLRQANFFLKNAGETLRAYSIFAYVLELEPTNKSAKLGRILALCYLSNLRRPRFSETYEMLTIEKDGYHLQSTKKEYIPFLLSLDHCLSDYIERCKKKLTFKNYFFDVDCLKLYFKRINEVLKLKRLIASELSVIDEEKRSATVTSSIKELEKEFNKSFYTADGQEQRLVNFAKSGDPLIVNGKGRQDTTKILRTRMSSLDANNKKTRYINDDVFSKANLNAYHFFKTSLAVVITLAFIATGLLVLYFIFIKKALIALLIISGALFLNALLFLIMRLIFGHKLKKPRL